MALTLLHIPPSLLTSHPALLPRIAHVHLTAFLTNHVYAAIYPEGYSQALIDSSVDRHRAALTSDPTARYLAVIIASSEPDSGGAAPLLRDDCANLVAFAKYHVFTSAADEAARKDTAERVWPAEMNQLIVKSFWGQIQAIRRRWGPRLGGPHVQLDILATDPAHMRRGAGKMIMHEVTSVADQLALPAFLEGSPEGVGLYRWAGFVDAGERIRVDLGRFVGRVDRGVDWRIGHGVREGEETGGKAEGWYENVVMVRPAKGRKIEDYLDGETRIGQIDATAEQS